MPHTGVWVFLNLRMPNQPNPGLGVENETSETSGPIQSAGVCRGAKPLCRESEGVPQIFFFMPPRLGDKGG